MAFTYSNKIERFFIDWWICINLDTVLQRIVIDIIGIVGIVGFDSQFEAHGATKLE